MLATNAFPPLLRRLRLSVVPVYDYALMTEPLTAEQLESSAGRAGRRWPTPATSSTTSGSPRTGASCGAATTPSTTTAAASRPRSRTVPTSSPSCAEHFFTTFPQLEGLRFTHRWAGVIDTCSRFCQFCGTALDGRVAYVLGYTGLGVVASRFGARVALDLLGDAPTELTELRFVRRSPLPFPPEPLRLPLIEVTRGRPSAREADGGRRNAWLRTLDRFGLGFDS